MELLQPYLADILLSLMSLLATLIIAGLLALRKKIFVWINGRNGIKQKELLNFIANEAFSLIESSIEHKTSQEKINGAIFYATKQMEVYGIEIKTDEIRAIIESVVLKYNKEIGKI